MKNRKHLNCVSSELVDDQQRCMSHRTLACPRPTAWATDEGHFADEVEGVLDALSDNLGRAWVLLLEVG